MNIIQALYGGTTTQPEAGDTTRFPRVITLANGESCDLSSYQGKVVLVVNTASKCGFTRQYDALEALYQRYRDQGFEVLGVPSNDFAQQEPGSDQEIQQFCRINHGVTFKVLPKTSVKGQSKGELFKILTEHGPQDLRGEVKWNFEKFLIDRDGRLVGRWRSYVKPDARSITRAIETVLPRPSSN